MNEVSVLIGGKAGDGINSAGALVAQLLNHSGYRIYLYFDYPSLIRGGHNYAIVRGSETAVGTCRQAADFILALDQDTLEQHRDAMNAGTAVIFNRDTVKAAGQGVPVREILSGEHAPEIMGNSAIIGGFAKAAGIPWATAEAVLSAHIPKKTGQNLDVARRAYDMLSTVRPLAPGNNPPVPLLTGNEAVGIGLVRGGLEAYVSYPMTPSSSLLHFLAEEQETLGITVVHPENEIAVILMALGFASAGKRAAVGTSGGGFCLMTEGLSLAGMAELPVVLLVSQRTGPSTGLPTYTGQADLLFVRHAGQGEFPRFIVAPATAGEALYWSAVAMDIAWEFQVPAFILSDKTLSEGTYSTDMSRVPDIPKSSSSVWDRSGTYHRYSDSPSGISPMAFFGTSGAVVKVNSYAHDEAGITTEEAGPVERMAQKRMRKEDGLRQAMDRYPQVAVSGTPAAPVALLCWGSTDGVCREVAGHLGLQVVRPVVLSPFPEIPLKRALEGVHTVIAVEENATAQLAALALQYGITCNEKILRYDGRPFTPEILTEKIRGVLP
ncbi:MULTISPECIES: 2-oxoacid:acceptor oxidoreductase subunit alpha [unclassified Methanoregula]|uniref:2-oxoacid:acceptor oxidoreductase subunit alpha n=1 Tax=unclassified Methanoregula TaxID=2649730 RepID=UPI0009CB05C6|nr:MULTISPECIES: 2-oxoacid:acceptor oxidoreductase subunit alpha [unclassified Methanoregula]OPX64909.1 MAG: 2-oxoglutarate synthase subunit KorA [Methanoregula sp. PtaB.Bin085]OPY32961.1 MAG: 2-oxoglutarate synthase subunit KorA [Methanoregula sp. PtaU1.Bin006]